MSETVSKDLLTGGSEASETSVFIGKVDQFFNALNVTNYTKGIKARKPFQKPYFNKDDPPLEDHKSNDTDLHAAMQPLKKRKQRRDSK